ncbi:hypothetical protein [Sphingomonas azotifigens]|uniref:hypothetical protein n=1 Tax=Sphingomonas azotifigens TaxID=330920 RepID=UPI001FEB8FB6|nr:hypothetical protein [Sphingomonas azotifigens]
MLVILMVREAGLRSMLAARLALSGIDVVSMEQVDAARIARLGGSAPVLVADLEAVQGLPGGLAALCSDPLWHRLMIVGGATEVSAPHLHHITVEEPASVIAALLRDDGTVQ